MGLQPKGRAAVLEALADGVEMPVNGERPTDSQILTLTSLCSQAGAAMDQN